MILLNIWWRTLRHLNHRGYIYIWANLAWIALSLPILTAPAAWAGLTLLSNRAQTEASVSMDDFWEGFIGNLKPGLVISVVTIGIVGINVSNLVQYSQATGIAVVYMRWAWLIAIGLWWSVQTFAFAMLPMLERPTLLSAIRNAALFVLRNPLSVIGLWLTLCPLVVLSLALPPMFMLLTGSITAILVTQLLHERLAHEGAVAKQMEPSYG